MQTKPDKTKDLSHHPAKKWIGPILQLPKKCGAVDPHSLTHSSTRVGDSKWPLYCLSSPLFPVWWHLLQLNVATATPLMSSIHCLLGLPWWCKPSTLPSKTVGTKFPALPLVTCPKYCSFIRAIFHINSLSRPISSNIDILVPCSFQEIPSIFLQHHISCSRCWP